MENGTRVLETNSHSGFSFGGAPMDNRLREIRVIKRVTQFRLRLSTGIHQSKISMIENGLMEAREDEKQKLAKALHVKSEEIWDVEEIRPQQ